MNMADLKAFLAVFLIVLAPLSFGLDRVNLVFYLPFENSLTPAIAEANPDIKLADFSFPFKGSFSRMDAAVSKDKTAAQKKSESTITFVPGRKGLGLKVTDNPLRSKVYSYPGIQYMADESLSRREGTIAVWMKPVGWSRSKNNHRYFMAVTADNCVIRLYMYGHQTYAWVDGLENYILVGGSDWQGWQDDTWAFLAFTFAPGQQSFYINGQLMNSMTEGLIEPEFSKTGIVEISEGSQVLDELMIFNRVLAGKEINAIYKATRP